MTHCVVRGVASLGVPLCELSAAPCLSKCQRFTFPAPKGPLQHNVRHRRGLCATKGRPRCEPETFTSRTWGSASESPVVSAASVFGGASTLVAEPPGGILSWALRTPHSSLQRRFVARVKVHRFAGVVPLKVRSPKSEWYIQAEKEFLSEREQVPEGYIERWREEDLESLNEVACLTEKILNARQHLLRHRRDHSKKRILSIWLARRQRVMKYLYRTDFDLYKLTCSLLRKHVFLKAISPVAVDGDRCKFLIRQRLWKGRYRPRPVKQAEGKTVRYTRHVMEQPPPGWNMPHETKPRISRAWPYGVKEERLKGEYTIPNPTAAGIGHCPVPLFF